jgi:abortive infection bacteriophage resistance protein
MALIKFNKPALPLGQQLQKWTGRGLKIDNSTLATHYLKVIGYYRFSSYALPFQDGSHPDKNFKPETDFKQLLALYIFDRELRLLVLDAIERIEVAVRANIVNEMCVKHGPHWFVEASNFATGRAHFNHDKFLDKIDEELGIPSSAKVPCRPHNEVFINHYYSKYNEPYLPPAWMVFEVLSLSRMSQVFANLKDASVRNAIASHFGIDEQVLQNWLHSLSHVRNICAHHRRLWNRKFVIKPIPAKKLGHLIPINDRFYCVAVILHYMMGWIAPKSTWHRRLYDLLQTNPMANLHTMGLPQNWHDNPFWLLESGADFSI